MLGHNIIVIGASAGGVEALQQLVRDLPADLPAALFVVIHFPTDGTSILPKLLNRVGPLPAVHAQDGASIEPGHIYIAPPDFHLLLHRGHMRVVRGPRENGHRPAVDPLFRTAALAYGPQVVGVILTGTLDDGVSGLQLIKAQGGVSVVQDPNDALYDGMPRNAVQSVEVDWVAPLSGIAARLVQLAHEPVSETSPGESTEAIASFDAAVSAFDLDAIEDDQRPGMPSVFSCPDCGGVLWERDVDEVIRFRCRVGHAFSSESLLSHQENAVEKALWAALRALEERRTLLERLVRRAASNQQGLVAERFRRQAESVEEQAAVLRDLLLSQQRVSPPSTVAHDMP